MLRRAAAGICGDHKALAKQRMESRRLAALLTQQAPAAAKQNTVEVTMASGSRGCWWQGLQNKTSGGKVMLPCCMVDCHLT